MAFVVSQFALTGSADALREGFREWKLAITLHQRGDLNTKDPLSVPLAEAAQRGAEHQVPVGMW
ncbi:hypothetical protein ACQCLI_10755 [Pseudomonas nitroreducens]|uniref:hypothetical protein n=1 Tax=Pseudomonas TaxID=286 RepID=UPI0002FE5E09|nr:hypothetical protein [Pseudomonas nitroreducens]